MSASTSQNSTAKRNGGWVVHRVCESGDEPDKGDAGDEEAESAAAVCRTGWSPKKFVSVLELPISKSWSMDAPSSPVLSPNRKEESLVIG